MSTGAGKGKAQVAIGIIRRASSRERFLAVLSGGPIMPPDAVVCLCGEDWEPRLKRTVGRFAELDQWARAKGKMLEWYRPVILLTGGRHEPPAILGARQLAPKVIGLGIKHDRVLLEETAQNTLEQAERVIDAAVDNDWHRLMVIASPYHIPRAFLTFLKVLQERGLDRKIEILPDAADQAPWFECPAGLDRTRVDLLDSELTKIANYGIASYDDGLAYLEHWETSEPDMGPREAA